MRSLSQNGREFLKRQEAPDGKPMLVSYLDEAGIWTIGWGHRLNVDEGDEIDEGLADAFLDTDLLSREKVITECVKVALTDNQYAALVSFVFNEGATAFWCSTLLKKLNVGDLAGAAEEFSRWVWYHDRKTGEVLKSEGLARRRAAERNLFQS